MKINDILSESQLDELLIGPGSGAGALATRALGALGFKGAQAKTDLNQRIKDIYAKWNSYATKTGQDQKMVQVSDINAWLKAEGLPTSTQLGADNLVYDFTKKDQANNVFKILAQTTFKAAPAAGGPTLGQRFGTAPIGGGTGGGGTGSGGASVPNLVAQIQAAGLTPAEIAQLKQLL